MAPTTVYASNSGSYNSPATQTVYAEVAAQQQLFGASTIITMEGDILTLTFSTVRSELEMFDIQGSKYEGTKTLPALTSTQVMNGSTCEYFQIK